MAQAQTKTLARSFLDGLGQLAIWFDELPIEKKQPIKQFWIRLLTLSDNRASIELLTKEDDELRGILSVRGWWILQRDINGPVKRELLRLGRDGKTSEIDCYLCSIFSANGAARLQERIEVWFNLPYLADRRQIVLDSFEAHKAGKWTLAIPTLLPLIDGVMRGFRKRYLRPSKNPNKVIHADKFAEYYRRKQPKLFGKSFASFILEHMFVKFDINNGPVPSSINRHAILHGETFDYATEVNSLKTFLLLDTISQFIQDVERRRKSSSK